MRFIERETLDSALHSGRSVLETLGWSAEAAQGQAQRFRQHTIDLIEQMAPHFRDEKKVIDVAKQGREQLEQMWARERAGAAPVSSQDRTTGT